MSPHHRDRLETVTAYIDRFALLTGKVVSWLTIVMMILTCIIVVLRYGFSIGSIAMQETLAYLHASVFLLAIAFTLQRDGHVRVDIFYRQFNARQKAWVNALGSLIFLLPICLFTLIYSWDFVINAWAVKEGSASTGGLPAVFLLKTLIPLAATLLALQGAGEVLRSVIVLTAPEDAMTPHPLSGSEPAIENGSATDAH
ncbi:TRAP transporter small permease subunit [Aestuariicella hydrocarbonica]|uniref:TRAP transporter small permease protein n=1 Tax=Pseudomaricurvus hydrocarbonicus TaxID=1470433 RepID=A0A9E5MPQ5_9GAMM|nr:TRAP transporter small permease subunit [Aestuariicella hydrocarbonica]NHO68218.1 TRAP transporter small permease subunit [Aestuariicella hydrocarbonica]